MTTPSSTPLVSLGLPVYNGERYLPEALASMRAQDYDHLEIIISDNASTDATADICREAVAADDRIRYIRQDRNMGGAWNCNTVLAEGRGEFIKIAACDDVMLPGFVSACVAELAARGPDVVMAFPRTRLIDSEGNPLEDLHDERLDVDQDTPHERMTRFLRAQAAHLIYGLMRADAYRSTRGMRYVTGCDIVLMIEMACRGKFALVPEKLFLQRRYEEQFSAQGADHVKWYAPDANVRFAFPEIKLATECYRALMSSPLTAEERTRCVAAVTQSWVGPRWRGLAGDVKMAALGR